MLDRKLTYDKLPDGEIKKVLECCLYGDCQDCFYGDTDQRCCRDDLMQNCLEYFNRLQAENERLKKGWKADAIRWIIADTKAEAYKEFAERLKENSIATFSFKGVVMVEEIDNLLKEMAGDSQ